MLKVTCRWEFDNPVIALSFVSRVIVHVLGLRHVNSSDSFAMLLTVPWVAESPRFVACGVKLLSLVSADSLSVLRHEHESIGISLDALSLDGSVF